MINFIKTSAFAAAAVFALSGVTQAESVTVNLVGKDAHTIHADIVKAAHEVCREVGTDSIAFNGVADCVSDSIEEADAEVRQGASAPMRKAELSASLIPSR